MLHCIYLLVFQHIKTESNSALKNKIIFFEKSEGVHVGLEASHVYLYIVSKIGFKSLKEIKMKQNKKSNLIKRLLSDKLTPQERESYADLEPIKNEIKKQWEASGKESVDLKIKEKIWKRVKAKCNKENNGKVHVGLGTCDH